MTNELNPTTTFEEAIRDDPVLEFGVYRLPLYLAVIDNLKAELAQAQPLITIGKAAVDVERADSNESLAYFNWAEAKLKNLITAFIAAEGKP